MTIKNYYFYIKPLLKKIKKGEYQYLNKDIIENDENILLFKKFIKEKHEDEPFFVGYYNFLLFSVAKFCIKNHLNHTLEDLINILEIDIYITRNFNYLLTLSMIHKNYYFIKNNIEKIEYSQIKYSIKLVNIEVIKIINSKILKNHKNDILYEIASLENLSKDNEEVFIFLIENYGYNKYYKTNGILNCLCENRHFYLIKYLDKNKLIDIDIDFNDFLYSIIKNNHEDIFIFFLENYNINIHYKYNSLYYRIFLFDRVNFLEILNKYKILNKNHFKFLFNEFIHLGAWNCFYYLLENNYIKNKNLFSNLIEKIDNINECSKVKKIDLNINIKKYIENKIKLLNYILKNINKEDINHFVSKIYSIFEIENIEKEFHVIEDTQLNLEYDNNKIKKILSFNLSKEVINFIINNENHINEEVYHKKINWLFLHSMYLNNIFIMNFLLENKQSFNEEYFEIKEDIYSTFYDYLQSSFHYIEFEELKFFVNFFNIDLSYNNNCFFYYFLSSNDAFVNKDYYNMIDYFLSNKKVQEKLTEDIVCDCYHGKDKVLEKIKQIKKIQNF